MKVLVVTEQKRVTNKHFSDACVEASGEWVIVNQETLDTEGPQMRSDDISSGLVESNGTDTSPKTAGDSQKDVRAHKGGK